MKIYPAIILIIFALSLTGCAKFISSYTTVSIPKFDDFINISSNEGKENYIREGKLDHTKIGDVFIVPFIKEITHTECALFIYAYSTCENNTVCLESVILTYNDGIPLYEVKELNHTIEMTPMTDTMIGGVYISHGFNIDDAWYCDGSELKVDFKIYVKDREKKVEEQLSYDAIVTEHRRPLFPT